MLIVALELKKLLRAPAVIAFILVMLTVNAGYVFMTSHKAEIDYMNGTFAKTGTVYGVAYEERLATLPAPDDVMLASVHEGLMGGAEGYYDSFEDLRTDDLWASDDPQIGGALREMLEGKYGRLEPVIAKKAADDDARSVYFSVFTNSIHETVFTGFLRLLTAETGVLALLLMLLALCGESLAETTDTVWPRRAGRRLALRKLLAAVLATAVCFAVIYGVSYAVMFSVNDYSLVWDQNVSAFYHNFPTMDGFIPFVTWTSLTVREFFVGASLVSFLNCAVAGLFAAPFALLLRSALAAFGSAAALLFIHLAVLIRAHDYSSPFDVLLMPPLGQILLANRWFTDGGAYALFSHFETANPLLCAAALIAVVIPSYRGFRRKDLLA